MNSMPLVELELSRQVCDVCRRRKKKCDKKLPTCGYCSLRALVCHGSKTSKTAKSDVRAKNAVDYPSPASFARLVHSTTRQKVYIPYLGIHSVVLLPANSFVRQTGPATIHGVICYHARYIIRATGRSVDEITGRFFQGIHRWMPIISKRTFYGYLMSTRRPYVADFSILLLALALVTHIPRNGSKNICNQETLYVSTKMLFTQVQASIPFSTALAQASILIAIFEYATGRSEVASQLIRTCTKMEIRLDSHRPYSSPLQYSRANLESLERRNILWGAIACERIFNFETSNLSQPLTSMRSNIYNNAPYEAHILDREDEGRTMPLLDAPISASDSTNVGSFRAYAQAACLADNLFTAMRIIDMELRHEELFKIDKQIQEFLSRIMKLNCNSIFERYCGAISIGIRALFTLHHHILEELPTTKYEKISKATLDTMTKLVIDIAYYHKDHLSLSNIDTVPPSYIYIAQLALEHMSKSQNLYIKPNIWNRDYNALKVSQDEFFRRWCFVGKEI